MHPHPPVRPGHAGRGGAGVVVAVVAGAAVAGLIVALLVLPALGVPLFGTGEVIQAPGGPSVSGGGQTSTSADGPSGTEVPRPVSASATCTSPDSVDASGVTVRYGPENALDGRTDTAWRCDGDGAGAQLRIDLGRTTLVTRVGLLPGYDKLDLLDGTDRFAQNRRVSSVRHAFDDGTSRTQNFDVADRSVQSMTVPAVSTRTVTVTVLDSVAGADVSGRPAMDKIAVSEVVIS